MKLSLSITCFALTLLSLTYVSAAPFPWEKPYTGQDAIGADVIALWHFDQGEPAADASGHGHNLILRSKDSQFVADGKFGGGLQIVEKDRPGDVRQGATTQNSGELNPKDAFTIEMWISPSEQLAGKTSAMLLDKKYYYYPSPVPKANTGYMLALRKADEGKFIVEAQLGFGKDSAIVRSDPQTFNANQWYHVTFTYDGQGTCTLYLGNTCIAQKQFAGRSAITPGDYPVVIGDRFGSLGQRFPGRIDEVRLLNKAVHYISGKVLLDVEGERSAFLRMEANAKIRIRVLNDTSRLLHKASIHVSTAGIYDEDIPLPDMEPGKSTFVTVPVNTRLCPDQYQVIANAQDAQKEPISDAMKFPLTIVSRSLPNQLPIIMWGNTLSYKELMDLGYNGEFIYNMADYNRIWNNDDDGTTMDGNSANVIRKQIDDMLAAHVNVFSKLTPGEAAVSIHPEFNRIDRLGKKIANTDGLYPKIQKFAYDTGAAVAKTFGDLPGWKGALIHTEVRDGTAPSFNDIDKVMYRKFNGQDIPPQITSARGISYNTLPDFPSNHIIPDDDPILQYYKWFWKQGDAWPKLNLLVNAGLKSTGRKDILTWFDPSIRAPAIYGSGGDVDYINQWTYTYPNPLDVGLATDEQFAMAEGHPGQKVMSMVQIIWYRSRTTQTPAKGQETEWEKISPKAQFISIAPDHLSEGTWLELSRPVQAIANHGWGSLGDHLGYKQGTYVTTNIDTRKRVTSLYQDVIKPLGPTLMQVPDYTTDVAFLESFTSQMFAGRGTYGSGRDWGTDSYIIARYAGLQPQIVYDETIEQKGLQQYKVLFLTDCDVLSKSVADKIKEFQQRGGIVIGDEHLAPGISPDILLNTITRSKPDVTKDILLKQASQLQHELDAFYQSPISSSNPEIITRLRQFDTSQYLFTVNDNRTYGDYVGQYKLVMEKGLPATTVITLNRSNGFVYDLINHRQVQTRNEGGKVLFPVNLEAGGGDVFLITDKPVGRLQLTASPTAKRGDSVSVKVLLDDQSGQPLNAVVPFKVTITDAAGQEAEKGGYYGAANGMLNLNLDIAPNDAIGKWQIEVQENITGQRQSATVEILNH